MKAKIKETGEIVEVERVSKNIFGRTDGIVAMYSKDVLDFNLDPPHPEATISGWVARDKEFCEQYNTDLWLGTSKPIRKLDTYWAASKAALIPISPSLFPSLTWQDEPIEVEITIKPKKIC